MAKTKTDFFNDGVVLRNNGMPCPDGDSWQSIAMQNGWHSLNYTKGNTELHKLAVKAAKAEHKAKAKDRATGHNLYAVREHVRILQSKAITAPALQHVRYSTKIEKLRDKWGI